MKVRLHRTIFTEKGVILSARPEERGGPSKVILSLAPDLYAELGEPEIVTIKIKPLEG